MAYDVVTLGETMIRLTPPDLRRIEQATYFNVEVGGSESNVAVGLARMGLKVLWISRLTDNGLGRLIEHTLAGQGVDTSRVVWTDKQRTGLYFLEEGKSPRSSQVIYDRKDSAISHMGPGDLPMELFRPKAARLLHLSGITPALGPKVAAAAQLMFSLAKVAGWKISFDLNYRSKLWTPAAAQTGCEFFNQAADLLLLTQRDALLLYGGDGSSEPTALLDRLAERYPQATLVLTLGAAGALAREPGSAPVHQPAFTAEAVGRIGGGDAFAAGFLYGYLTGSEADQRLSRALRWGAATAALKYSLPGDMPLIERAEVEALVNKGGAGVTLER